MTPNERAFITISDELRRLENSLVVMEVLKKTVVRMDQWTKTNLADVDHNHVFTAEMEGWLKVIPYICDDGSKIREKADTAATRIEELKKLQEVFLKGGNIVAAKLSGVMD